jgi:hypothetical protein
MPKPKYKISSYHLSGLKWYLEVKIGFNVVTKIDCKKIADLIQFELGISISESTLYRLFIWNNNNHTPYYHTLEILAKYIGYDSWQLLENEINSLQEFQFSFGKLSGSHNEKSLLQFNIHSDALKPLYNFLEQFPKDIDYNHRMILGQELFLSLKTNPNRNIKFFKEFSTLPVVRSSFYEFLADPDFSIPDYEFGLINYLNAIKPHHSLEAMQDFIFANTLLLRYYFTEGNKEQTVRVGKLIYDDLELSIDELEKFYIFPRLRYMSYKMIYFEVQGNFNLDYFKQIESYTKKLFLDGTFEEQRIILHTLLDTLQFNPELQMKMIDDFKIRFEDFFQRFPNYFFNLTIKQQIHFLNPNAASIYPNGFL